MPRYAGLVNLDVPDNIVDRMLAAPQEFHDAEPSRIPQGLKHLYMHNNTYVSLCICHVKAESLRKRASVMEGQPCNRKAWISAELLLRVKCRINGLKHSRIAEWLEQALYCTQFEESGTNTFIGAGSDKDDRNLVPTTLQFALKIGSAHPRHGDVENEAFGLGDATGCEELFRR